MATKLSDCWQTPKWLFDELNEEFSFDIDLCATKENSKCLLFYRDYINNVLAEYYSDFDDWMFPVKSPKDVTCFMNPPYSNPKPFIEKAWEDSKHCKIVCLVKCDPSTRWWAAFWDYNKPVYCPEKRAHFDQMHRECSKCKGTCRYVYNGPKPGCEVRFFPKRIKFDPPQELIDSRTIYLSGKEWYWKPVVNLFKPKKLSGPTFSSALVIMDRRNEIL